MDTTEYARRAAEGMLRSLAHYGDRSPTASDGRVATPAYYANQLGKALNARGDQLPGDAGDWWGHRWARYARQILASDRCPATGRSAGVCADQTHADCWVTVAESRALDHRLQRGLAVAEDREFYDALRDLTPQDVDAPAPY